MDLKGKVVILCRVSVGVPRCTRVCSAISVVGDSMTFQGVRVRTKKKHDLE